MSNHKDQINTDINQLRNVKLSLISQLGLEKGHKIKGYWFSTPNIDAFSTPYIAQQCQNYLNSGQYQRDLRDGSVNKGNIQTAEQEMDGWQSKLDTDRADPKKNMIHLSNRTTKQVNSILNQPGPLSSDLQNAINKSRANTYNETLWQYINKLNKNFGAKTTKPEPFYLSDPTIKKLIHQAWNQNNYNYDRFYPSGKKPFTSYEDANSSWKMASGVMDWTALKSKTDTFKKMFTKPHKGFVQYRHGNETYYIPQNQAANYLSVNRMIDQYHRDLNKQHTSNLLTNNLYHKMWKSIYPHNNSLANKTFGNEVETDENNHPSSRSNGADAMAKALTNYRYQIQKDRIWQQYHQNQINYMGDYAKSLENQRNKIQSDINWNVRHNRTNTKHYSNIVHQRDKLNALIHNRLPVHYVNHLKSKRNKIQIKINKYYKEHKQKSKAYKQLIHQRNKLNALMRAKPRASRTFYNQEVKWRDDWKKKADALQNRWKMELNKARDEGNYIATIDNLNVDHRNGHFAYIRPVNPNTVDSYVFMMVTDESPEHTTNATSNPVEWGRNITTGTQQQPTSVTVSGYLFNDNLPNGDGYHETTDDGNTKVAPSQSSVLDTDDMLEPVKQDDESIASWSDAGAEVFYSGIHMFPHCTITSWNPDYNMGSDGSLSSCSFSMTLQLNSYFQSNAIHSSNGKSQDTGGKKRSRGKLSTKSRTRKYRVKAGQTMSTIALRCHVPLSKIERLNHKTNPYPNVIRTGQTLLIPRHSHSKK